MLQEADYDTTQIAFMAADQVEDDGDKHLLVRFVMRPKLNQEHTEKEGRPIYEEMEYVEIMVPGNKDNVIVRPARTPDQMRFPKQYAMFKANNNSEGIVGTLLEQWPAISRAQVEELKFFNIRTVEQLANVSDGNAQKFMGINALKTRARAFLEACGTAAEGESLAKELEERDLKIMEMQQANEELMRRLTALEKAKK